MYVLWKNNWRLKCGIIIEISLCNLNSINENFSQDQSNLFHCLIFSVSRLFMVQVWKFLFQASAQEIYMKITKKKKKLYARKNFCRKVWTENFHARTIKNFDTERMRLGRMNLLHRCNLKARIKQIFLFMFF